MYEEFPSVLSGLLLRMYKKWRHKSKDVEFDAEV